MITRTITVAGRPNVQITLYFSSRSNADKPPEKVAGSIARFVDDYQQNAMVDTAHIISDLTTDVKEMLLASGEMEVIKLHSTKKVQERIDNDPLLKVWLEMQRRNSAPRGMPMPGMMMPQA